MANEDFFPKTSTINFTIKNVSLQKKRLTVFGAPLEYGATRDLLALPEITESYIRSSLIKGELYKKIKNGDIVVISSSIDLLQYDSSQKTFLQNAGITTGLETGASSIADGAITNSKLAIGSVNDASMSPSSIAGKAVAVSTLDIGIHILGDSTAEGRFPVIQFTDGSGMLVKQSARPIQDSRDKSWSGTTWRSFMTASGIVDNTLHTGANSIQLSEDKTYGGPGPLIISELRRRYPTIGATRLAVTGVGGSRAADWNGEPVDAYLSFDSNPTEGQTLTPVVGGPTYTFRASPSVAYDVQIADTAAHTARNFENAVCCDNTTGWTAGGVNSGSGYFTTGTIANSFCFVGSTRADALVYLVAVATGTAGNAYTGTLPASVSWGFGYSWGNYHSGSATSHIYTNSLAAVPPGSFGHVNIAFFFLGTNDANLRSRGQGYQTELSAVLSKYLSDYNPDHIVIVSPATIGSTQANTALTSTIQPAIDAIIASNPTKYSKLDLYLLGNPSGASAIIDPFGLHWTAYGHDVVCSKAAIHIATLLGL